MSALNVVFSHLLKKDPNSHLQNEILKLLSLCFDALDPPSLVNLQTVGFLNRVGGQTEPLDLLLLFGDDVHGHEHVEGVIDTPPDVLLVVLLVCRR